MKEFETTITKSVTEKATFKSLTELKSSLLPFCIYRVSVKITKDNAEHKAFLFTGFIDGGYWELHSNSYDSVIQVNSELSVYSMKVLEYITNIN